MDASARYIGLATGLMLLAVKLNLRSTCENNKRSNLDHNLKNNGENRVAV